MRLADNWRKFDFVIFFAALLLTVIGLSAIWSVALSRDPPDFGNLRKQVIALAIGLAIFALLARTNYAQLRRMTQTIGYGSVLLLLAVLVFGTTIRGTRGWFDFGGFSLQPVELVKIALPILLAKHFSDHAFRADFKTLLKGFAPVAIILLLVLLQPDLGSALLLLLVYGALVLLSGISRKAILGFAAIGLMAASLIWSFALAPYQKERVQTFLNPARDPLGRGYNLAQSIIAVGSGGWLGRGLGAGTQSQLRFLPESQTDFLFAVIAEELGFLAVAVVLILYLTILFRAIRLARATRDNFTAYLVLGAALTLGIQAAANMSMNVGLLPVAGMTLPFLSYGGSSLIASFALLGLIESVAIHRSTVA